MNLKTPYELFDIECLWTSHTNDQTYIINEDSIDKVLKNIKN